MIYLIAILAYLLALTGIGIYKARQVQTAADFSVAGRTLAPWILICTMLACWIGTGSIVGNAGKTYETGLAALILPAGSVTGIIITATLIVTFPVVWFKAGGWSGMETAIAAMGKPEHMQFWGVYSNVEIINYCLPVFLLIMGDANQYQRFFASKDAKGAKTAATFMTLAVLVVESLIILEAWVCSSMIPNAENGKYVLIYAAKQLMPLALGTAFMITVVGIIISTADSFLLVPSTCFIRDIYLNYINPKASEKRIIFLSRALVLTFGVIAWLVSLLFAESTTVFKKALIAFTIYGAAITPCLVAALFWKGATRHGAVASIVSGIVVALAWENLPFVKRLPAHPSELDAALPAIAASVVALVLVSLATQKRQTIHKD